MASATATPPVDVNLDADGMHRHVGFLGLFWASEGSIIGSGWLFGALAAASLAGPAAILGWIVASIIVIGLALVHAELGGIFPVTGGTARFPHYAFGSFAGGNFGWMAYLQAATVAPIEVLAVIQYLTAFPWASSWYNPATSSSPNTLHSWGFVVAIGLMILFTIINLYGIRWLAQVNNYVTTWKVVIPILTIIIFLLFKFHSGNFSAGGGFFPKTDALKDILFAIPSAGIVFSLLGFEQAVQLGGEARNGSRDIPRAVILSILLGSAIYVLAQVVFIGTLDPSLLAHGHTWADLAVPGKSPALQALNRAPFYSVAKVAGLLWLAFLLRLDAVISPAGTGLVYGTSASRILFGLSKNGYVPSLFERVTSVRRVPVAAVIFSTILGLAFLLPFPSWYTLVGVVTSASVLMYAGAPLALGALRLSKPDLPRVYRLPAAGILCPLTFIGANYIVYWSGWGVISTLVVAMAIGYVLFILSGVFKLNPNQPTIDWIGAPWVLVYLIGMALISYFGQYPSGGIGIFEGISGFTNTLVGANGDIPLYWDFVVVGAFSLVIYYWAMWSRLPSERVDKYVEEVFPTPDSVGH
jgi:amino acid transporter